jgi:zinc D-Ala-D-Ala carboxypeptidase
MQHVAAVPTHRPAIRTAAIAVVVLAAAIVGLLGHQPASASAPSLGEGTRGGPGRPTTGGDGELPDGVTAFDDGYAGVANLRPDLLEALRRASSTAARDGVTVFVNSGWRSASYQDELLREAVAQYGSEAEAARWVATAKTSPHVAGEAVDVGHADAAAWLSAHGAAFGLCQVYRNEPWHFELRPGAVDGRCPRMYADPTRDPRMQP